MESSALDNLFRLYRSHHRTVLFLPCVSSNDVAYGLALRLISELHSSRGMVDGNCAPTSRSLVLVCKSLDSHVEQIVAKASNSFPAIFQHQRHGEFCWPRGDALWIVKLSDDDIWCRTDQNEPPNSARWLPFMLKDALLVVFDTEQFASIEPGALQDVSKLVLLTHDTAAPECIKGKSLEWLHLSFVDLALYFFARETESLAIGEDVPDRDGILQSWISQIVVRDAHLIDLDLVRIALDSVTGGSSLERRLRAAKVCREAYDACKLGQSAKWIDWAVAEFVRFDHSFDSLDRFLRSHLDAASDDVCRSLRADVLIAQIASLVENEITSDTCRRLGACYRVIRSPYAQFSYVYLCAHSGANRDAWNAACEMSSWPEPIAKDVGEALRICAGSARVVLDGVSDLRVARESGDDVFPVNPELAEYLCNGGSSAGLDMPYLPSSDEHAETMLWIGNRVHILSRERALQRREILPDSVFISYRHEDVVAAEAIDLLLRESGIETWRDTRKIHMGANVGTEIISTLTNPNLIGGIALITPCYLTPREGFDLVEEKELPVLKKRACEPDGRFKFVPLRLGTSYDDLSKRLQDSPEGQEHWKWIASLNAEGLSDVWSKDSGFDPRDAERLIKAFLDIDGSRDPRRIVLEGGRERARSRGNIYLDWSSEDSSAWSRRRVIVRAYIAAMLDVSKPEFTLETDDARFSALWSATAAAGGPHVRMHLASRRDSPGQVLPTLFVNGDSSTIRHGMSSSGLISIQLDEPNFPQSLSIFERFTEEVEVLDRKHLFLGIERAHFGAGHCELGEHINTLVGRSTAAGVPIRIQLFLNGSVAATAAAAQALVELELASRIYVGRAHRLPELIWESGDWTSYQP